MKTDLEQKIISQIQSHGPLGVDDFMALVMAHYYATRDPFGVSGDFTTAPEISQMFGEMIGAWIADTWQKLGAPTPFFLIEGGPGRGTLMADILWATKSVSGFHEAAQVVLMETSPALREKQADVLAGYDVQWIESLDDPLVSDASQPFIFIANELLDALPMRQAQCHEGQWCERVIGLQGDKLVFETGAAGLSIKREATEGEVFEFSPVRELFVNQLSELLKMYGGAALLIDYGHNETGIGDTLQAVKNHKFAPVLEHIGDADLTSHVDFEALIRAANGTARAIKTQGEFLEALGIGYRARILDQAQEFERLCALDQMGEMFKVMALCSDPEIELAGF